MSQLEDFKRSLKNEVRQKFNEKIPCYHMTCPDCFGTRRKKDGTSCIHMINCPCLRCRKTSL